MTPPEPPLDVDALTERLDRQVVKERARPLGQDGPAAGAWFGVAFVLVLALVVGGFATVLFALVAQGSLGWLIASVACGVLTVAFCVWFVLVVVRDGRAAPEWRVRLAGFARANGLEYVATEPDPDRRGVIFARGDGRRRVDDVVRWPGGALEVGVYRYVVHGARGTETPWQWGYARFPVGGQAPDLLLDARANNTLSSGGALSDVADLRMSTALEAPGGERFTLWAWPRHADRARAAVDAELLALLARRPGGPIDLEVVDGVGYLYATHPLGTADPDTWRSVLAVARLLGARQNRPRQNRAQEGPA